MAAIEMFRLGDKEHGRLNFVHNDEQYRVKMRYIALLRSTIASNAPLAGSAVQSAATSGAAAAASAYRRLGDALQGRNVALSPEQIRSVPLELPFPLRRVLCACVLYPSITSHIP